VAPRHWKESRRSQQPDLHRLSDEGHASEGHADDGQAGEGDADDGEKAVLTPWPIPRRFGKSVDGAKAAISQPAFASQSDIYPDPPHRWICKESPVHTGR